MIGNRLLVDLLGDFLVSDCLSRLALNPCLANIPAGPDTKSADSAQALIILFSPHGFRKSQQQKPGSVFSFLFVEFGLTGPLLVELFYGMQIHDPVAR
jgi:hypothetical protein